MGQYGDVVAWPEFRDGKDNSHRADITRSIDTDDMEKYYFQTRLKEGWCALKYPGDQGVLALSFPSDKVPYLGILLNENGWKNDGAWDELYNIFLEPCTGTFDRIDCAKARNQCSKLRASGEYSWHLNLTIDSSDTSESVTHQGEIL
jgi:hypothetical protein